MAVTLIFIAILLAVFGQLSMKKGMIETGQIGIREFLGKRLFSVILEKFVILGIILYVLSTSVWLVVLSQEELSFAYPLVGTGYIITAILSKIFFKENLTMSRIAGIFLIVVGAYLIVIKL